MISNIMNNFNNLAERNAPYNPQAPGTMVIDGVITFEGACHVNFDFENMNGWHQSRLTHFLCQELHRKALNKSIPSFFKDKISIADTTNPATSLPGQLTIKGIIAPDGACYYNDSEKNLDTWHYTKLVHFICKELNAKFENMQMAKPEETTNVQPQ